MTQIGTQELLLVHLNIWLFQQLMFVVEVIC